MTDFDNHQVEPDHDQPLGHNSSSNSGTPFELEYHAPKVLQEADRKVRKETAEHVAEIRKSIEDFGFVIPVLIEGDGEIVDGHIRRRAAIEAGLPTIPCIPLAGLDETQRRKLKIAVNKLQEKGTWDVELLKVEFEALDDLGVELTELGFETGEIDVTIGGADAADEDGSDPADRDAPAAGADEDAVTRLGDLWRLGDHRVLCGNALADADVSRALGGDQARMVLTDPPYNVPIDGHVCGAGATKHREFAMASGEMDDAAFETFLADALARAAAKAADGAIFFVFMDWRHAGHLTCAAARCDLTQENLCVWVKDNGGMGGLYRSRHELVFVFKVGAAKPVNNVQLGKHGRNRTNVWEYPGVNTLDPDRKSDLQFHPTVKPVALCADAIRDVSHRGDVVLDPFLGSGTTLLAAERTGRRCAGLELSPPYCDVIVRRWEDLTSKEAVREADGATFATRAAARDAETSNNQRDDGGDHDETA